MENLFAARLENEPHLRLWLETIADVGVTGPKEQLQSLVDDLRHVTRSLAKTPRFVAAALFVLTVGICATAVVFSLISAVLLHPLPYGNPERLVYMWTPSPSTENREMERQPLYVDLVAWRNMSHSFQEITGVQRYIALMNDGTPERLGAARVLGNFFQTMQTPPQLGRTIKAVDQQIGKQGVVVLSDRIWQVRFGKDPSVLGKTIHVDRHPYLVIGVMPKEFSYPHENDFPGQYQFASIPRTDLWIPAAITPKQQADREFDGLDAVIGRLRSDVSLPRAQSEISAIEKRINALHAEGDRDLQAVLVSFIETSIGTARPLLLLLLGAVCLVLLMVCVNFATLLMARAGDRIHELGVRTALGAQRSRLVRLMLAESLTLSVSSGALAVPLSYFVLKAVTRLNPGDIPRFEEITIDTRVLLFSLSVSIATGLISGVFPAITASLVNVGVLLRQGGRGVMGGMSSRVGSALIVSEIALAVVLLSGAGLFLRSYIFVQGEDKGFSRSTLTMSMLLDEQSANADSLRRQLMNRVRSLPSVELAGSIDDLPLSSFEDKGFVEVDGYTNRLKQLVRIRETGGEYFRAMQIPLIAGRYLTDSDIPVSSDVFPQAVVISKTFAEHFLHGKDALKHRLRINGGGWRPGWSTIVGVIGDVRHSNLEETPQPIIYFQSGLADSVAIRTKGSPDAVIPSIRKAVSDLNAGFSVTDVQTMNQYVDHAAARRRFQTVALTVFAAVAVLLALVGLYGLVSYRVKQRSAEIGVRMTIGASRSSIIQMVVFYGVKLASIGLAIGIGMALALTRVIAGFVYGIRPLDPLTFVAVPAFILTVVVISCVAPAWKAARIDPVDALRHC